MGTKINNQIIFTMQGGTKKTEIIDYLSSRPTKITINIAFVSSLIGYILNVFTFHEKHYDLLVILDASTVLILLVTYLFFVRKKIGAQLATTILVYVFLLTALYSSIIMFLHNESYWEFFLLRNTFLIIIFEVIVSIILNNKHLVIVSASFSLLIIVMGVWSYPSFISDNTLFFAVVIPVFAYGIYRIKKIFINSLSENLQLIEEVNLRNQEVLTNEIALSREKELRLNEVLSYKKTELLNDALLFAQNKETLNRMKKSLHSFKKKIEPAIYNELCGILTESLNYSKSFHWNTFQNRFFDLHIEFAKDLVTEYPDLTSDDQRLAALLKLNFSTKEISLIVQSTQDNVEEGLARLQTKFGLSSSEDLYDFLAKR